MKLLLTIAAAAGLAAAGLASAPAATAAPRPCATIQITGHHVPVTRGQGGPIVRHLKHGSTHRSCVIERGNEQLHACGGSYSEYYVVPAAAGRGGIIPLSCARVIRR
ncbi:hypothetical protein ACIPW9_37080 [Streptomyces sp. NPDC090052]|uniref:hypothetical protein n=1 Tax=unclassified Streptomyces TaxID=2593676 RepID=UPI003243ABE0